MIVAYWNITDLFRINNDFTNAYNYSTKLIRFIEEENVFSLEINRRFYFFKGYEKGLKGLKGFIFKGELDKKCYSYFTVALTCYLKNLSSEAQKYIEEAKNLCNCDRTQAIEFLRFSISSLQYNYKKSEHLHKEKLNKLEKFKKIINELDCHHPDYKCNQIAKL